jgi:hypothetical protein
METIFYSLATKNNFNKSLRHFFKVNEVVDDIEANLNLADVVNEQLDDGEITAEQILPIVGAVIRDKYNYSYDSFNVPKDINDFKKISEETLKWTALSLLIVYYNPSGDIFLINPKNPDLWERVRELARDQLMVIYAKHLKPENDKKLEKEAIEAIKEMIAGKDVFINKDFIDQTVVAKPVAKKPPTAAPPTGQRRMTPKYAVTVSNELFHNGNVEAWKKIVESYTTKFPDLEVVIYFEGEVINDINALFKWGKVKHGDPIMFQIVGENIRGVSKLQKYLYEGASPRFEQFLKIDVGKVLNLF